MTNPSLTRVTQVGGDHYTRLAIQPWDVIEKDFTPEEIRGYVKGTILGYIMREKNPDDLAKIQHFMNHWVPILDKMEVPKHLYEKYEIHEATAGEQKHRFIWGNRKDFTK